MLKRENRIRKQKEFDKIYRQSKRINSKNFRLLIRFTTPEVITGGTQKKVESKFGFIITKKVGNAVIRNKTKRRFRAIIREFLPDLKSSFEAVIIAFPQIVDASFEDLRTEVKTILWQNNLNR